MMKFREELKILGQTKVHHKLLMSSSPTAAANCSSTSSNSTSAALKSPNSMLALDPATVFAAATVNGISQQAYVNQQAAYLAVTNAGHFTGWNGALNNNINSDLS
uniref:Uncharacterized protein n=1 Tax=Meloidogyne javanica TaxID=6303 RepID=A0A915LJ97_MELJA